MLDNQEQNQGLVPQQSPPSLDEPRRVATPEGSKQELKDAIAGSQDVLVTATTVFPLELFPDTLTVDRAKLTVTKRRFFAAAEVMSMRIEDVLNTTATVGPFFGSVTIISRVLNSKPYTVGRFWRKDALRLKRITQGYIIALQRGIDCSSLSTHELSRMLDELGEDNHSGV